MPLNLTPVNSNNDLFRMWAPKRRLKVNAAAINTSETFTGSGLNDVTPAGTYTGVRQSIFKAVITTAATPDKFDWYRDGVLGAAGVSMTGSPQALAAGVTIDFTATTGHTVDDFWEFEATILSDFHKVVDRQASGLILSADQKVWYGWAYSAALPVAVPSWLVSTSLVTADHVQAQILAAGENQLLRIPWALLPPKGNAAKTADALYLWVLKHTSDALIKVVEV